MLDPIWAISQGFLLCPEDPDLLPKVVYSREGNVILSAQIMGRGADRRGFQETITPKEERNKRAEQQKAQPGQRCS